MGTNIQKLIFFFNKNMLDLIGCLFNIHVSLQQVHYAFPNLLKRRRRRYIYISLSRLNFDDFLLKEKMSYPIIYFFFFRILNILTHMGREERGEEKIF